jgi:prepilin-type N-terminal cleavage/methylation domain-containing protein
MSNKNQEGFSLVELIVVFTIIGIIATLAFPSMKKARDAAENGNAVATMRSMVAAQYNFYTENGRYGRLDEVNDQQLGAFGTVDAATGVLERGNLIYQLSPDPLPTDADLKDNFQIKATRPGLGGEPPYVITVDQSGTVVQIF